jgi:hypothetical protein
VPGTVPERAEAMVRVAGLLTFRSDHSVHALLPISVPPLRVRPLRIEEVS